MTNREVRVRLKALEFIKAGSLELDSTVDELKALEATEINNQGSEAQINYIVNRASIKFLEDIVGP